MDAKIAIMENEMTNLKTNLVTMLLMVEEIGVNAGESMTKVQKIRRLQELNKLGIKVKARGIIGGIPKQFLPVFDGDDPHSRVDMGAAQIRAIKKEFERLKAQMTRLHSVSTAIVQRLNLKNEFGFQKQMDKPRLLVGMFRLETVEMLYYGSTLDLVQCLHWADYCRSEAAYGRKPPMSTMFVLGETWLQAVQRELIRWDEDLRTLKYHLKSTREDKYLREEL
ncbi:hypothetical protein V8G54_024298 [Vigna mungo]|uniref:Uncharacterized protein n=1 Tax=Vigna mungo TaxID=3915 RepID=A0AAQ3N605_VIGMU